ncbi:MAG TPA: hypothetical protein VMC07_01045 [Candidatus Omnitrophota bacterium]|nr:hypothetical protein [Candidatus Omnitrophota bacterium]
MRKIDKIKILSSKLPPKTAIGIHSLGRQVFLCSMKNEEVRKSFAPEGQSRNLWGINFRAPLFNAAGMFKDFSYYEQSYSYGAGAYLVGTITPRARPGNVINGIHMPFVVYPQSHAASNNLGLPNPGIEKVLQNIPKKKEGFPIGISLASESLEDLAACLRLCEKAEIDFVEINESCPNIKYAGELTKRLEYLGREFLSRRKRNIPIVVKFSNDLHAEQIPDVLDLLIVCGADGINLGNSSTDYDGLRNEIHMRELRLFDYYTKNFRGGISGRPLKDISLQISSVAAEYIKAIPLEREFNVIRTGGIESSQDIAESNRYGISLNEWFTGYFERYTSENGSAYKGVFRE